MKIYSITEILEASDNILKRDKKDINNKNKKKKTFQEEEPLILSNPIESKPEEKKNKSKDQILEPKTNFVVKKIHENNDRIVNEIYNLLNKKYRKSTLKIILDQQSENKKLLLIIKDLRKKGNAQFKN